MTYFTSSTSNVPNKFYNILINQYRVMMIKYTFKKKEGTFFDRFVLEVVIY